MGRGRTVPALILETILNVIVGSAYQLLKVNVISTLLQVTSACLLIICKLFPWIRVSQFGQWNVNA